ncbi:MAG: DsrE family protein [Oceanicaulis sp.]|nr:DsrE family protein [Oceanicaulis sp.]
MKHAILALALAAIPAVACASPDTEDAAAAEAPRQLVTIVTAADPQTQLMAMVLTAASVRQGAQAHVMLCGPGGDIALRDAPASATDGQAPRGASPQGLMQTLMSEHGVTVEVCAIYLPGLGADASVLLDGVTPASPDAMAQRLLSPDATVLTF